MVLAAGGCAKTMSGNVTTIATAIARLDIEGVNVHDLDNLPVSVAATDCPLLAPRPTDFMSNLQFERQTFSPGARTYTLRYTLNYMLFYQPLGATVSLFDEYPEFMDTVMRIVVAFAEMESMSGATEIVLGGVPEIREVTDVTGTGFHGALFALDVLEICTQGE